MFIFTIFFSFLTFERLKPRPWRLAHFLSIAFSPIPCRRFLISFSLKSYLPFCTKKCQYWTCRHVLNHNFNSKANFKKSRARFFSPQTLLAEKTKRKFLACLVFNVGSRSIFCLSSLFLVQLFFKIVPKHFIFDKFSDKKKVWIEPFRFQKQRLAL